MSQEQKQYGAQVVCPKCGIKTPQYAPEHECNRIVVEVKQALQEVEMIKSGQLKGKSVDEMLEPQCDMGCMRYTGFEARHLPTCPYYPDSLSRKYDEMEAENARLKTIADLIEQRESKDAIEFADFIHGSYYSDNDPYENLPNCWVKCSFKDGEPFGPTMSTNELYTLFTQSKTKADGEQ